MAELAPEDSILNVTKKLLNIPAEYTPFDLDIITHINAVFASLHQMGVGPSTPFMITDASIPWTIFIGSQVGIESVRTYMASKVRIIFDPPATSFGQESLKEVIRELEWRLLVSCEEHPHG